MKINYNGLWKILIDKNMNKQDLAQKAHVSKGTIAKMGRGEFVSLETLYKIAVTLNVDFGDMISIHIINQQRFKI